MNVLILSANTGQGHNSCSEAIKEIFESNGNTCEICDSLAFVSKKISRMVTKIHLEAYRKAPRAFGWGYRVSENHPGAFSEKSPIYKLFYKGAKNLEKFIEEKHFDIIISCHVFAADILTAVKKLMPKPLKMAFVATDYTRSPGVDQSDLDYYFIPDESLRSEFTTGNITKEKIHASGIPVRQEFIKNAGKETAKEQLGIDKNHKHLIVMCGSMGCGPIEALAKALCRLILPDQEVSIICGTNKKLEKRLSKHFKDNSQFHIYGYVKDTAIFMDSADVYLTKPGGISVVEAAAKRLPMVFVNAVSGCEDYNCKFFTQSGGAITAKTVDEIAALCEELLKDDERRLEMAKALEKAAPKDAAGQIYSVLNN